MEAIKWYCGKYSQIWHAGGGFDCKHRRSMTLELKPDRSFQMIFSSAMFQVFYTNSKIETIYTGTYKTSKDTGTEVKIILMVDKAEKETNSFTQNEPSKESISKPIPKFIAEVVKDKVIIKDMASIIGKEPVRPLEKEVHSPPVEWYLGDYKRECKVWNTQGGEDGGYVETQLKADKTFKVCIHWEFNDGKEVKDYICTGNYEFLLSIKNVALIKLFVKEVDCKGGDLKAETAKPSLNPALKVLVYVNKLQFYEPPSIFEKELLGRLSKRTNVLPWYIGSYKHTYNGPSVLGGSKSGHRDLQLLPSNKFLMVDYDSVDDGGSDACEYRNETSYFGCYEVSEDTANKAKVKLVSTEAIVKNYGVFGEPDQKDSPQSLKSFEVIIDQDKVKFEGAIDELSQEILIKDDYYLSNKSAWYLTSYEKEYEREREPGLKSSIAIQVNIIDKGFGRIDISDKCNDSEKAWIYNVIPQVESIDEYCAKLKLIVTSMARTGTDVVEKPGWDEPDESEKEIFIFLRYSQLKFAKGPKGLEDSSIILDRSFK